MKKLTVLFLFLASFLIGQTSEYMCLNWGLMKIGDSIMIDEAEISIGEWLDFVSYHDVKNYPSYVNRKLLTDQEKTILLATPFDTNILPDMNIISAFPFSYLFKKSNKCEAIKHSSISCNVFLAVDSDSLKNPSSKKRLIAYLNMPIVGISYELANKFCQWRTTVDSLRFYIPPTPIALGRLRVETLYGTAYIYRLPTPKEFDKLNPAHDSIYNKKTSVSRFNYKNSTYPSRKNNLCGKSPINVYSFQSSTKSVISGTENMQGNVAEMTTVEGIAKGGSYNHFAKESYPAVDNIYDAPQSWLGFRCVGLPRQK